MKEQKATAVAEMPLSLDELVMLNETSRFNLVLDVIDRVPKLRERGSHLKEEMKSAIIENMHYAHEYGADRPEISNWTWPY